MVNDYESLPDRLIEHLGMIQDAVVRYGNLGVHTKRWSFVFTAGLAALAVQQQECLLGAVSILITFGLWALDHDYLRSERLFRLLYERVRAGEQPEPFFMDATGKEFIRRLEQADIHHDVLRWKVFRSESLWMVYGSQILAGFIVWLVLRITVG